MSWSVIFTLHHPVLATCRLCAELRKANIVRFFPLQIIPRAPSWEARIIFDNLGVPWQVMILGLDITRILNVNKLKEGVSSRWLLHLVATYGTRDPSTVCQKLYGIIDIMLNFSMNMQPNVKNNDSFGILR